MKTIWTAVALVVSAIASAQNCSVQYTDTIGYLYSIGYPASLPNGGFAVPYSTGYGTGDLMIATYDGDANRVRTDHKMTVNPAVLLFGKGLRRSQDGGAVVFGDRLYQGMWENAFMVKLDSLGNTEWARIYWRRIEDAEVTADGGMLLSAWNGWKSVVIKTDPMGVPEWGARDTTLYSWADGILNLSDGNHLACAFHGDSLLGLRKFDQSGTLLWSTRLNTGMWPGYGPSLAELTNGDLVVCVADPWGGGNRTVITLLDGNGIWQNTVTMDTVSMNEVTPLATGGFISYTTDPGQQFDVVEWSPNLVPLNARKLSAPWFVHGSMVSTDDTLRLALAQYSPGQLAFVKAAAPYDLSCVTTSVPLPAVTPFVPAVSPLAPWVPDSIRSWEMALTGIDPNVCDISVGASSTPLRPGFSCAHHFVVENQGGVKSAAITATATLDPNIVVQSASPQPNVIAGNTVTWSGAAALAGLASSTFHVVGTLPPDTALLGQTATSTFSVQPDPSETSLANNTYVYGRTIGGSYDPNDKLVFPKDFYHITGDSILDYTIRFQNTGTDTAFNIVVIDTLPPDVDVLTFQAGAASHPYTYSLTGEGLLKFTFNNILLPDSNTNEPLSHGLVNFRIKPIQPIYLGQTISNEADIYFDFNPPVRTPPATVVVTDFMAVKPAAPSNELKLYPVPVRDVVTVELPKGFLPRNAIITGSDGRAVWSSGVMNAKEQLNIPVQNLATGAYTLTLLSKHGDRSQARFVKE